MFIKFVVFRSMRMMDLSNLFRMRGKYRRPNHVALTVDGTFLYASQNKEDLAEVFKKNILNIKSCMKIAVNHDIPILTFNLLPDHMREGSHFTAIIDSLPALFEGMNDWEFLHANQMKVSVFGKWYDLPARVVEPIKTLVGSTKDYDRFFVNFCINYSGQEEIVDACKLIIKKVEAGKINPDTLSKEIIKDNIYSSYFLPPDLIIKTGKGRSMKGFLLWDSANARIHFADKHWPEFSKQDFEKALEFFKG